MWHNDEQIISNNWKILHQSQADWKSWKKTFCRWFLSYFQQSIFLITKHDDQAVSLIDRQNDICKETELFLLDIKNWKSDSNDENDFLCFKNK